MIGKWENLAQYWKQVIGWPEITWLAFSVLLVFVSVIGLRCWLGYNATQGENRK